MNSSLDSYVVLLSAGLDSTVNLHMAHLQGEVALALTFDYGQKAAEKECECSASLCKGLGIPHRIIELPFFKMFAETALVNDQRDVPTDLNIERFSQVEESAQAVWVPNRNGILLNIAAGFAESLGASYVVPGFNKEEAATFPDNSQAYLEAASKAMDYSTQGRVQTRCFTAEMDKTQIVKKALELGVETSLVWPCYLGKTEPCRECESCLRFYRALEKNGVSI